MKSRILSIFMVAPLLMACGANGTPAKGYKKWKDYMGTQLSGIKYKTCNYAYLKNVPEQPELTDTCYYYSTFTVGTAEYYSYYAYKASNDRLVFDMEEGAQGEMYYLAVSIIATDSSYGNTGTL